MKRGMGEGWRGRGKYSLGMVRESAETYIFIASNCSFFGIISSICGARRGYVVTSCVLRARWMEDLTFDFEPGEILWFAVSLWTQNGSGIEKASYSFLNILIVVVGYLAM